MTKEKRKFIGIRIASMFFDHLIMTFIMLFIGLILFGIGYLIVGNPKDSDLPNWLAAIPAFFGIMVLSIYINKDAIKGKGPGKRILGLIIVDNKTGQIANPIKSVIRNITIIFWPIEVIFILFSPERRIGDYIAGTKVISDNQTLQTKFKIGQIIGAILIGQLIMILLIVSQFTLQGGDLMNW
jgi:uncharacterized RDD family membrane protein YckC